MKRFFVLFLVIAGLVFVGAMVVLFNSNIDEVTHSGGRTEKYFLFNKMLAERNYDREGNLHGTTKLYYGNGNIKRQLTYKAGKLHGVAKHYSKDGQLLTEDHYSREKKVLVRKYDKQGNMIDEKRFD